MLRSGVPPGAAAAHLPFGLMSAAPPSPLTPRPGPALRARAARLPAVGLLLLFAGVDLWAVVTDQRQAATDTTTEEVFQVEALVREEGARGLVTWYFHARKGPISGYVNTLITQVVGDPLLACRLSGVALNLAVGWLVFAAAARLSGSGRAGLLALAILGTFPGHFGWFRMDSHEPFLVLLTLLTLLALMRPLASRWLGVQLGLLFGLGFLAKFSYPIFVLFPALLFVAVHLREPRLRLHLPVAAAVALLLTGPWFLNSFATLHEYAQAASNADVFSMSEKLRMYTYNIPGAPVFLAVGVAGAAAALFGVASRQVVGLLVASVLGGLALLLLVFDPWARYLTPAFPSLALLTALGGERLLRACDRRFSRRAGHGAAGVAAAGLLVMYGVLNVTGLPWPEGRRMWGAGLVSPDQRPYDAFPRMVRLARQLREPVFRLHGWPLEFDLEPRDLTQVWRHRGFDPGFVDQEHAKERLRRGEGLLVLFGHEGHHETHPTLDVMLRNRPNERADGELLTLLARAHKELLAVRTNPDDYTYALIRALPRQE